MKRFVVERERLMIVKSKHIVVAHDERDAIAKTEAARIESSSAEAIRTLSTTTRPAKRGER